MPEAAPSWWPRAVRRAWAQRRRRNGHYDRRTLAIYAALAAHSGAVDDLLAWALFRRDLGHPLARRAAGRLVAGLGELGAADRRLALGLLAERAPQRLAGLPAAWLTDAGRRLPALASRIVPPPPPEQAALARIERLQDTWRQSFAQWLAARRAAGGVAVVGNAAALRGRRLGATIDASAAVVRFNNYGGDGGQADAGLAADIGLRLDVWVVSPGYRGPAPERVDWAVVSGPDMRYRLQDWSAVAPLLAAGTPVLTVPLVHWRSLVRELRAPPSAGVLLLQWLSQLDPARGWHGLAVAGIGSGLAADGRYHTADLRQRPAARHYWAGERALVQRWVGHGLACLGAACGEAST